MKEHTSHATCHHARGKTVLSVFVKPLKYSFFFQTLLSDPNNLLVFGVCVVNDFSATAKFQLNNF